MRTVPKINETGVSYCKMPDGTLIQWGSYQVNDASVPIDFIFPLPFINVKYSMSYCIYWYSTRYYFVFYNEKTTSLQAHARYTNSDEVLPKDSAIGGTWMAIGRWK